LIPEDVGYETTGESAGGISAAPKDLGRNGSHGPGKGVIEKGWSYLRADWRYDVLQIDLSGLHMVVVEAKDPKLLCDGSVREDTLGGESAKHAADGLRRASVTDSGETSGKRFSRRATLGWASNVLSKSRVRLLKVGSHDASETADSKPAASERTLGASGWVQESHDAFASRSTGKHRVRVDSLMDKTIVLCHGFGQGAGFYPWMCRFLAPLCARVVCVDWGGMGGSSRTHHVDSRGSPTGETTDSEVWDPVEANSTA